MDTEQIVQALASAAAPVDGEYFYCLLCGADMLGVQRAELSHHDPGCPWRMAREWAARLASTW